MPIHLPPLNRRRFLTGSAAAGFGFLLGTRTFASTAGADPNVFLLLADIHVPGQPERQLRGVRSMDSFKQAVGKVMALADHPAAAIVAGDCAFKQGEANDYASLAKLIAPLRKAGVPMHFALGNHDHRERFLNTFPDGRENGDGVTGTAVANKHVAVLETPHANWFMLDSLDKTDYTPGRLGEAQLDWLGGALDTRRHKPAIVLAHHNPDPLTRTRGLLDTTALFDVLKSRRHVKAYVFGHTHSWQTTEQDGIHLVNLPTTAWVFDNAQPRGFVTAQLQPDRAKLTLHALDAKHAKHGQTVKLKWRS